MSVPVDLDDAAREFFGLWSAPTANELHRILVLSRPVRGAAADAFEPFALLNQHHEREPATSLVTALLLLTDRRWRNASARLVRQIADSEVLDGDQLDLLARTFVAADEAVYWHVPDEWFAGGDEIVVDLGGAGPVDETDVDAVVDADVDDASEADDGPTVARRDVWPPLRRWAASHLLATSPDAWSELWARASELDARSAAAIVAGVLDGVEVLEPAAQRLVIDRGVGWPDSSVRRRALELIAARDGADEARRRGAVDPNARIRAWAARLVEPAPEDEVGVEPPSLF